MNLRIWLGICQAEITKHWLIFLAIYDKIWEEGGKLKKSPG